MVDAAAEDSGGSDAPPSFDELSDFSDEQQAALALFRDNDACASTWPRARARSSSVSRFSPLESQAYAHLTGAVEDVVELRLSEAGTGRHDGMSPTERSRAAFERFEQRRASPPRRGSLTRELEPTQCRGDAVALAASAPVDESAMTWPRRGKLSTSPPGTFFLRKVAGRTARGSLRKVAKVDAGVDATAGVEATADADSDDELEPSVVALVQDDEFARAMIAMMLDKAGAMSGATGRGGVLKHVEVARTDELLALALAPRGRALKLVIIVLTLDDNSFSAAMVKAIREQPHLRAVALVAVAEIDAPFGVPGEDFRHTKSLLLAKGFDDVIAKPPRAEAMVDLVQRYVRKK